MMRNTFPLLFCAALLAQTGLVAAQDSDAAPAATEDTTAAPETTDTAEAAPEGPQVGQPYILEEHGDWQMRCVKAPEGQADPCNLYQLLVDGDGNEVAEINLFSLPEGSRAVAGATIVVPLETLLTEQVSLAVDGGQARTYPFSFCNRGGCVARVGFTDAEVTQFKRGNSATVRLVPAAAPDQPVLLNMSLSGFTAGYDAVVNLQ